MSKTPAQYWSILIAAIGVILSAVALLTANSKTSRDDVRELERRLCQLEMRAQGHCER